jgi:hypothetical protein
MRDLARQLLAANAASDSPVSNAVAVCDALRIGLTKFAGADGFAALLRRALAIARVEAPSLQNVTLGTNCHMEAFDGVTPDAAESLVAHLLHLLVIFIGEPLALRLVRETWPDKSTE